MHWCMLSDPSVPSSWPLDNYSRVLHKLCFTTTSNFPSNGCLTLTFFVVCIINFIILIPHYNARLAVANCGATLMSFLLMKVPIILLAGRETPSVAGIINPGSEGFQKLFFGQEEIAIPVHAEYVFYDSQIVSFWLKIWTW